MVSESRKHMEQVPRLLIWPSLAIALAIGSFTVLGDRLRDAFDPRLHRLTRRRAAVDHSAERIGPLKEQGRDGRAPQR